MAVTKRKKRTTESTENETDYSENEVVENKPMNYVQKNPNYILIILLMAVSFFSGYLLMKTTSLQKSLTEVNTQGAAAGAQPPPPTTVSIDKVKPLFADGFIHFGNSDSDILIVEITDPSCPYCHIAGGHNPELSKQANFQYVSDGGQYTPIVPEVRKLVDEGKASLAILYGTGHQNGRLAMEAMYCAFDAGDFWPVHDRLMGNEAYALINDQIKNDRTQSQALVDFLAQQTDATALKTCLDNATHESKLARDEQEIAPGLAFQGTPHFIVNETIVNGAQDYNSVKAIVDPLL